jgi:hypothetical protein
VPRGTVHYAGGVLKSALGFQLLLQRVQLNLRESAGLRSHDCGSCEKYNKRDNPCFS